MAEGRSLAETPTWSVATVTTVMVAVCFIVERSIYRFGKWLKKTKRKALLASLDKIKEELMLLGLISLMLGQWARWISEICVNSSLFSSQFYPCIRDDTERISVITYINQTTVPLERFSVSSSHCAEGHEPFVSYESLEQLHRFLFLLGVTHVIYSCFTVVLAMIKIYSWRAWEAQANAVISESLHGKRKKEIKRQSTFVFHHASHPWSKNKILIWMLCFFRQFKDSIRRSDYMALRLGFLTLVLLVGTKLQHVVAKLALEVVELNGPLTGTLLKPRDELFWFGKPELLLWLIQFISFQWDIKAQSCFMTNHAFVVIRLVSGIVAQFWCSYVTLPLNVIISQMGSKFKKSLVSENVRESLHGWCKRVKHRSRHKHLSDFHFPATRSTCSLTSTVDEGDDETITVVSGTLSRCATTTSLRSLSLNHARDDETITVSGTISRCPSTTSQRSISLDHVSINCEEIYADDIIHQQDNCAGDVIHEEEARADDIIHRQEICAEEIIHQDERGINHIPTSGYLSDSSGNAPVAVSHESDVQNAKVDDYYDANREE
ncbi:unnamed protein product [Victoria cruziana]